MQQQGIVSFRQGILFFICLACLIFVAAKAEAQFHYGHPLQQPITIAADLKALDQLGIRTILRDEKLKVGIAEVLPKDEWRLLVKSHTEGRCGGYQRVEGIQEAKQVLQSLNIQEARALQAQLSPVYPSFSVSDSELEDLIKQATEQNLRAHVEWISSYKSRFHRQSDPNQHVRDMEQKLKGLLAQSGLPGEVSLINHNNTPQKSVRLRLEGSTAPQQIIALGGHFDSISGWSGNGVAPGADDDASGSSNVLEIASILMRNKIQPQRSLEFFWYAGEEAGLLGSAEIARAYKEQSKDVVAVLQLDMTLFPGSGEFTIGNISDNTSPWLRDYLRQMNEKFLKIRLVDDQCGYGCSDHASWHSNGYAALMPFEATSNTMNRNIHTAKDVIDSRSNFAHANVFTKLGLVFAWDLANSQQRPL